MKHSDGEKALDVFNLRSFTIGYYDLLQVYESIRELGPTYFNWPRPAYNTVYLLVMAVTSLHVNLTASM